MASSGDALEEVFDDMSVTDSENSFSELDSIDIDWKSAALLKFDAKTMSDIRVVPSSTLELNTSGSGDEAADKTASSQSSLESSISGSDLERVIDDNMEYCSKTFQSNPWYQYLYLEDKTKEEAKLVNPVDGVATTTPILNLQEYLEQEKLTPVVDIEEAKAVLGVKFVALSVDLSKFECSRCSKVFPDLSTCLEHMKEEEECMAMLDGTCVGFTFQF